MRAFADLPERTQCLAQENAAERVSNQYEFFLIEQQPDSGDQSGDDLGKALTTNAVPKRGCTQPGPPQPMQQQPPGRR